MDTTVKTSNLSTLVSSVCRGDYQETDLVEFVNLVQKISLSYLKYQEVIGKSIRWQRNKNVGELEDLALDCVAGLFMRNEKNEFVQFQRYFGQDSIPIEKIDEGDILVQLRRLVIKKTKQELSRIFKERDPEGAKIVRNIKVAIKSADDFEAFREMGREYIYFTGGHGNGTTRKAEKSIVPQNHNGNATQLNSDAKERENGKPSHEYLRKSMPSIPEKSLRGEYLSSYCPKDPVSMGIRKMLSVINSDERYQNFLPLDMVARIMRQTSIEMARDRLVSQAQELSPLDDLKLKEIEKRKREVLKRIKTKIQNQYVRNDKISAEKGDIYYLALADVLEDISQGKKYDSYYKHLRTYMPLLSQREYRQQERTIFEYLGKLIKKWFRESLLELL